MQLYPTTGTALPPDAIVSAVRTRDGLTLRVARWATRGARGTVLVATGRSEFIEQYSAIVGGLIARGFEVVTFDWRGQGQSDREIGRARRGYVSRFSAYRRDLVAVETQILRPFATPPFYAFGHSMGAAVLLDQAHDHVSPFERLVFSAPMIALPVRASARRAVLALDRLGLGRRLIPGGREDSILIRRGFADNILTSDPQEYARLAASMRELPNLAVGSPTIRWAAEAFRLIAKFDAPLYPIETLVPILILAAGADRIVDTAETERFALRLKAGRCITLPGARHQLIMERPEIVAQFWAAFDAFVPGESAEAPRAAAAVG